MSIISLRTIGLIILLWLAGLGAAAQLAKFAVPFSFLQEQYPDAGVQVGWLLTTISAVGAVLGMTAGVFVTRLGIARVLIGALLLGGGASLWQATLPDMPTMIASRLIEGVSHLAIVVAAPTLMALLSEDRFRGIVMTLWSTFFGVSFALTAWLGLPIVEAYGLDTLFIAHGVFMLVLAGILLLTLKASVGPAPSYPTPLNARMVWGQHVRTYSSPFISAPSFGWLFYTLTFVSLLTILPDQLSGDTRIAVAGFMPLVSIAFALIFVSALLSVMTATNITVFGFGLAIAVIALFFTGFSLPILCVALFAVLGLVQGASFAAVPELNSSAETQALAYGAMAQMGNLGNLLGTPIILAVLASAGFSIMLIVVAVLYALGGLMHIYFAQRRRDLI